MKRLLLLLLAGAIELAAQALSITGATGRPGESITLDLSLSSPAGAEPAGSQWTLVYPAANFTSASVSIGAAGTAAGKTVDCAGPNGSIICIVEGINQNKILNGIVAKVLLKISGGQGKSTQTVALNNTLSANLAGDGLPTTGGSSTVTINPPKCDVDQNGTIDNADVALATQQANGAVACSAGDIDGNSVCNVVDVRRVINALPPPNGQGVCREGT